MESNQRQPVRDCIQAAATYAAAGLCDSALIEEFLQTGRLAWSSDGSLPVSSSEVRSDALYRDRAKIALRHLYDGLAALLSVGARQVPSVAPSAITNRICPMVIGLLPVEWHGAALKELTRRIFVLTFDGTKAAIEAELSTGWGLSSACNLLWSYADYEIVPNSDSTEWDSFSSGAFAYIRWWSFKSKDAFGDAVVHEGAHLLYHLKPSHYGLQVPRGRERFVDVAFRQRRLFAFACEAYSQVLKRGDRESRLKFANRMRDEAGSFPSDILDEVATLVRTAASARNGWRVILDATTEDRTNRKLRVTISA